MRKIFKTCSALSNSDSVAAMPSIAERRLSIQSLTCYFPLTSPIPIPITHPDLLSIEDIHREEDLLRNPTSFRGWWSAIQTTKDAFIAAEKAEHREKTFQRGSQLCLVLSRLPSLAYLFNDSCIFTKRPWRSSQPRSSCGSRI